MPKDGVGSRHWYCGNPDVGGRSFSGYTRVQVTFCALGPGGQGYNVVLASEVLKCDSRWNDQDVTFLDPEPMSPVSANDDIRPSPEDDEYDMVVGMIVQLCVDAADVGVAPAVAPKVFAKPDQPEKNHACQYSLV